MAKCKVNLKKNYFSANNSERGFVECVRQGTITSHGVPKIHLPLKHKLPAPMPADDNNEEELASDEEEIQVIGKGMAEISNPAVVKEVQPSCDDDVMEIVEAKPSTEISTFSHCVWRDIS